MYEQFQNIMKMGPFSQIMVNIIYLILLIDLKEIISCFAGGPKVTMNRVCDLHFHVLRVDQG